MLFMIVRGWRFGVKVETPHRNGGTTLLEFPLGSFFGYGKMVSSNFSGK